MFNRFLYEKLQTQTNEKNKLAKLQRNLSQKRKSIIQNNVNNYKSKVRNFLVELASNPIELGKYQPPTKNIQRSIDANHRFGAPQMFINGFKTNKERIKEAALSNQILDYSSAKSLKIQSFRQRSPSKQIQPGMRFAQNRSAAIFDNSKSKLTLSRSSKVTKSQSTKNLKLPLISPNPQKKTYFKAVQEMGNSLKMMEQSQSQRIGLQNRLMIVMDGKQAQLQLTARDLLVKCKLLKKKVNSQRTLKSLKTQSVNLYD